MPFSYKTAKRQLQVLKRVARQIIKNLDYYSRITCSENGSVYIHSFFKTKKSRASLKAVTRVSFHVLQSRRQPDLDIIIGMDCLDDKFINDCAVQINSMIIGKLDNG